VSTHALGHAAEHACLEANVSLRRDLLAHRSEHGLPRVRVSTGRWLQIAGRVKLQRRVRQLTRVPAHPLQASLERLSLIVRKQRLVEQVGELGVAGPAFARVGTGLGWGSVGSASGL
jgi:hypothetical protein